MSFVITHPNGTHINVLMKVCAAVPGPILELGVGPYSTPILHRLGRTLVSVDDDFDWLHRYVHLFSKDHSFWLHKFPILDADQFFHYGVIFVDHNEKGGWRKRTLATLRSHGTVFVVHDTEPTGDPLHEWGDSLSGWEYSFTAKAIIGDFTRWTTVLSDRYPLDFLE